MSIENARMFYQKIKVDQELQHEIIEKVKQNPKEFEPVIIETAAGKGFQFTLTEMRNFMRELTPMDGELSDAQLEAVAGGAKMDWVVMSIGTFGLGCAASGIYKAVGGPTCPLDK